MTLAQPQDWIADARAFYRAHPWMSWCMGLGAPIYAPMITIEEAAEAVPSSAEALRRAACLCLEVEARYLARAQAFLTLLVAAAIRRRVVKPDQATQIIEDEWKSR